MGKSEAEGKASEKQRKAAKTYKDARRMEDYDNMAITNPNYARNTSLARDLDEKADNYKAFGKVGQYTLVGNAATFLGRANMRHQANKLRAGGMPVFDSRGKMRGVVSENFFGALVYSGDAAYSPIGRKDTGFNKGDATYTTDRVDGYGTDDGPTEQVAKTAATTQEKPAGTIAQATQGSQLAQKNAAVEAAEGGAATRYFLSRQRGRTLG